MISAKLKFAAALLLAVGLVGTGTSLWAHRSASAQPTTVALLQPKGPPPAAAKSADLHGDMLPEGALVCMSVPGPKGGISRLSVLPDGKTLTTHGADGTVRLWEMATGKELTQFKVPKVGGISLLSADGKTIVCGAPNKAIQVWDTTTGMETRTINAPNQKNFGGMALSPDGKAIAVTGFDQVTRCFDTQTGKEVSVIKEVSVMSEQLANNNVLAPFSVRTPGGRTSMVFSPDGATLAICVNGLIGLWDVETGKRMALFYTNRGVTALAFAPDGRTIATADGGNSFTLWEILSGKECLTITFKADRGKADRGAQANPQASLAFAADGRTLVVTGEDKSIRLFELPTCKEIGKFNGHVGAVLSVAFAPDSKTIVTGSADNTAVVWAGDRFIKKPAVQAVELDAKKLESLWEDLAGEPTKAYQARVTLATAPQQTLALLQGKVKPTADVNPKQIEKLIADLDSNEFDVRQKASTELEKLGELAQPALQKVLDSQLSLESRQRVDRILERLTTGQAPPPEVLRNLQAVQLLEQMGTAEARQLLRTLAKGAAGDRLTLMVESALQRLGNYCNTDEEL